MTISYGIQQLLDSSSCSSFEFNAVIQELAVQLIQYCCLLAVCFVINVNKENSLGNGTSIGSLFGAWCSALNLTCLDRSSCMQQRRVSDSNWQVLRRYTYTNTALSIAACGIFSSEILCHSHTGSHNNYVAI